MQCIYVGNISIDLLKSCWDRELNAWSCSNWRDSFFFHLLANAERIRVAAILCGVVKFKVIALVAAFFSAPCALPLVCNWNGWWWSHVVWMGVRVRELQESHRLLDGECNIDILLIEGDILNKLTCWYISLYSIYCEPWVETVCLCNVLTVNWNTANRVQSLSLSIQSRAASDMVYFDAIMIWVLINLTDEQNMNAFELCAWFL